jgi:hypothetical protein
MHLPQLLVHSDLRRITSKSQMPVAFLVHACERREGGVANREQSMHPALQELIDAQFTNKCANKAMLLIEAALDRNKRKCSDQCSSQNLMT